jgi:hypothetical protein
MLGPSRSALVQGIYIRSVGAAWALAITFLVVGAVLGAVLDHRVYVSSPEAAHHRPDRSGVMLDDLLDNDLGREAPPDHATPTG